MKIKNIFLVFKDQLPLKRMFRNFLITRNAWGLFYKSSHIATYSGMPKIQYSSKEKALKAAIQMQRKNPERIFKAYKCLHCDGFHIGKNRIDGKNTY